MPDNEDNQAALRSPPPGLGLGERLRSARKARALSVSQVAEALRLEEASVIALEDGRFDVMGAPVFVRGHLRRYAQLVGLSPEAVLDAYRAASPGSDAPPSFARPREQSDNVRMGPWVYWLAAGLLLAGLIIALSTGKRDKATQVAVPVSGTAPAAISAGGGSPAADGSNEPAPADSPPAAPDGAAVTGQAGAETRP